jgi:hypothetical protein
MDDNNTERVNVRELDFNESVKTYVNKVKPVVYILTPCFGGLCYVNYVNCLLLTKELFNKFDIELHILFCKGDSLVSRARNNLVAKAMNDEKMTHMMFIDNDITWDPIDIIKLLLAEKSLVGGIYPLKTYNFNKIVPTDTNPNPIENFLKSSQFIDAETPATDIIQMRMLKYNVNHISNEVKIVKNLTQVRHIATGFMMIQRNVIEELSNAYPETKYTDDISYLTEEENKYAYALFDCGVVDNHYLSEDWMFCTRWTKQKNDIWIDITINLTHTGTHDFKGCFISTLM